MVPPTNSADHRSSILIRRLPVVSATESVTDKDAIGSQEMIVCLTCKKDSRPTCSQCTTASYKKYVPNPSNRDLLRLSIPRISVSQSSSPSFAFIINLGMQLIRGKHWEVSLPSRRKLVNPNPEASQFGRARPTLIPEDKFRRKEKLTMRETPRNRHWG